MKLRGTALLLAQIAMVIGVIALVVGRPRDPHKAPAEVPEAPAASDAGVDAAASASSAKPPVSAVAPSATVREAPKPIYAVTGATISSRALTRGVRTTVDHFRRRWNLIGPRLGGQS